MSKKYLITGGAGFVGGNLAIDLAAEGHEVLCVDNLSRRGSELNLHRLNKESIKFQHCDIRCLEDIKRLSFDADIVLECSAQTTAVDGYAHPVYDFTNNTLGVVNVLEYCREKEASIIFWSSNKAYSSEFCNSIPIKILDTRYAWDASSDFSVTGWSENGFNESAPTYGGNHTIYGATKNAADILITEWSHAFKIPAIVNRFSCLYGPHQFGKVSQGWMVWFALAKKFGKKLWYYGNEGRQVRDCLHMSDLCDLIRLQSDSIENHYGSCYNVGGGIDNTVSVRELNGMLDEMIQGDNEKIIDAESRNADQRIYISDITKACNDFSWYPAIGIEKGLITVLDWINDDTVDFSWVKE